LPNANAQRSIASTRTLTEPWICSAEFTLQYFGGDFVKFGLLPLPLILNACGDTGQMSVD
jgi:hypothetical protein